MRIVTYNVNGLRSALSKGLTDWIAAERPDILCLQETKAQPEQIPTLELEALGYRCYFFSAVKKGYSGVAILTRREPDRVAAGKEPTCVHHCQAFCMRFGRVEELAAELAGKPKQVLWAPCA